MAEAMDSDGTSIMLSWTPEFPEYPATQSHNVKSLCRLKAPRYIPDESSRAKLDLVAVIDTSGSMSGLPLEQVKSSLLWMTGKLKDNDKFGLVTFSTIVRVVQPLTLMTAQNKAETENTIRKMSTSDTTNLCEGLLTGMYEIIDRAVDDENADKAIASVILFTDGRTNYGILRKEEILEEMRKAVNPPKQYTPFRGTVNTFGFGYDHDGELLSSISEQGDAGGVYYYIAKENEIKNTMQLWFNGLISTVSKNTTLNFTSLSGSTIKHIHTPREPIWIEQGKRCIVDVGDLQSEEERDFLVELHIPNGLSADLVSCEMNYINVISNSKSLIQCSLTVDRSDISALPTFHISDKNVVNHKNRLLVTDALKTAQQLAENGTICKTMPIHSRFAEAKKTLEDTKTVVSESISCNEKLSRTLLNDLSSAMQHLTRDSYKSHGAHYLVSQKQTHITQRRNSVNTND